MTFEIQFRWLGLNSIVYLENPLGSIILITSPGLVYLGQYMLSETIVEEFT